VLSYARAAEWWAIAVDPINEPIVTVKAMRRITADLKVRTTTAPDLTVGPTSEGIADEGQHTAAIEHGKP
jgi:hypothetical protein